MCHIRHIRFAIGFCAMRWCMCVGQGIKTNVRAFNSLVMGRAGQVVHG